jgi:tight adherence protein B
METQYYLPILIAVVAALFVFGVVCLVQGFTDSDKKKLQDRLGDERIDSGRSTRRSIVMQQMESSGLPPSLAENALIQKLHGRVIQAYPDMSVLTFLTGSAALAIASFLIGWIVAASLIIGLIAGAIAGYLPFFVINTKRSKRQKLLANQLPEALDFLSRILRAGHSLTTGLQMMGEELPQPIGGEFRRAYDQHSLGQALEESLKDAATRIESTDFAFFITAVLIQRQTGGDLSEVLNNISGMIRSRIRLQQHVKAKTAEGRFTGYILVAFPAVMFFIAWTMNPGYAGVLLHTTTGMELLGTAFGLQMLGLFAIRKITTVKV